MVTRRKRFINRWLTWISLGIFLSAFWILFGEPKAPAADPDYYGDQTVEEVSLGVLDFTADGVETFEAIELSDRLRSYLRRTRRMHVSMKNEVDYAVDMGGDSATDIEIGNYLRADLIITGTVSRDGRRYRMEAQVIDVDDGGILGECSAEASGLDNLLSRSTDPVAEMLAAALQRGGSG